MNWSGMIIGAVAGGAAALAAQYVLGKLGKNSTVIRYVIFAIVFGLVTYGSREFVQPQIAAAQTESSLLDMPLYQTLREYEPATYAQILEIFKSGIASKASLESIWSKSRPLLGAVLERRYKTASDESLRQTVTVSVDWITQLDAKGGDVCFKYLFPNSGPPVDFMPLVSREAGAAEAAAMVAVIKSSATAPQKMQPDAVIKASLEKLQAILNSTYKETELAALQDPMKPNVDRRKVCQMTADMYREVLKMPPAEGGGLLRYLFQ